jgi:hypothetical protein
VISTNPYAQLLAHEPRAIFYLAGDAKIASRATKNRQSPVAKTLLKRNGDIITCHKINKTAKARHRNEFQATSSRLQDEDRSAFQQTMERRRSPGRGGWA